MQASQQEKEGGFDFFSKFQKQIKKVERHSYRKVTVFAILVGVSFAFVWSLMSGIGHAISAHNAQSDRTDAIQQQAYITQVKGIDDAHFKAYINYLVANGKYYDSRIALISQSYSIAEQQDSANTSNSNNVASDLRSAQNDFLVHMTDRITNAQKIYAQVHANAGNLVSNDDYDSFLKDYHYFTSGLVWQDKTVETDLNNYLFASNTGNRTYNQKNGVFDAYNKLTAEAQAKVSAVMIPQ
jgi:hypothetical protein